MAATKVGEAYVEIQPRLARDFGKQIRNGIERQLRPLTEDLGRNVGESLGDSVGEHFSARFGDHVYAALDGIDVDGSKGAAIGERLGDQFGEGFSGQAREHIKDLGDGIEGDLRGSFSRVSEAASKTGTDIDLHLTRRLGSALSGVQGLTTGFASLASSAVLTTGQISVMAGALGAATQSALLLASALAPAAGIIAALPGVLSMGAAAVTTLKVAFADISGLLETALTADIVVFLDAVSRLPEHLADLAWEVRALKPSLEALQFSVQQEFFTPLIGEISQLRALFPAVQGGMNGVAAAFADAAVKVLRFARDIDTLDRVSRIFEATRQSVITLTGPLNTLLVAFRDLAVLSAEYINQNLVPALANAANRLAWFLINAEAEGKVWDWLEGAVEVFTQLFGIIGDVVGIVRALFTAVEQVGGNALGVIGSLLDGLRSFLASAQGQEVLVSIFSAIADIGSALLPVVAALATGLASLAPIIGQIAQLIGPILTTAVQALAPALASLGPALVTVFVELGNAVRILAESGALNSIAQALSAILIAVAPLLPPLVQLATLLLNGLATVITTYVAPALSQLVGWIRGVAEWFQNGGLSEDNWLTRTLKFLGEQAGPLIDQAGQIISQVFSDIVKWVSENQDRFAEWGDKLKGIIEKVSGVISGLFEFISWAWTNFGEPLLNIVANVFDGILGVIDGALTAIQGVIDTVMGVLTGDWGRAWEGIKGIFEGIWDAISSVAETIWNNFLEQFKAILKYFDDDWEEHWNQAVEFVKDIWEAITSWISDRVDDIGDIIDWFGELPGKFSNWFGSVRDAVVQKFNEVLSFFAGIPGSILNFFSGAGTWLYDSGRAIVEGLWNGIVSLWNWVISQWDSMVNNLINTVKSILGIASPSKVMHQMGEWLSMGLARGITASADLVEKAVTGLAEGVTQAWGSPELAVPAWRNPNVDRTPTATRPATDGLVAAGASGKVYQFNLHAIPTVPTERQIVDALDYADALYATA